MALKARILPETEDLKEALERVGRLNYSDTNAIIDEMYGYLYNRFEKRLMGEYKKSQRRENPPSKRLVQKGIHILKRVTPSVVKKGVKRVISR